MTEDLFKEKLKAFKEKEKPEAVLILADNPDLIKIVVAWTNMKVEWNKKPTRLHGGSESEVWDWLWKNTTFSSEELSRKSLQSSYYIGGRMNTLIGCRVIYPDGTVNGFVERYLREKVLQLYEAKPKRTVKKAS